MKPITLVLVAVAMAGVVTAWQSSSTGGAAQPAPQSARRFAVLRRTSKSRTSPECSPGLMWRLDVQAETKASWLADRPPSSDARKIVDMARRLISNKPVIR
jgi:hypothetical protein